MQLGGRAGRVQLLQAKREIVGFLGLLAVLEARFEVVAKRLRADQPEVTHGELRKPVRQTAEIQEQQVADRVKAALHEDAVRADVRNEGGWLTVLLCKTDVVCLPHRTADAGKVADQGAHQFRSGQESEQIAEMLGRGWPDPAAAAQAFESGRGIADLWVAQTAA